VRKIFREKRNYILCENVAYEKRLTHQCGSQCNNENGAHVVKSLAGMARK